MAQYKLDSEEDKVDTPQIRMYSGETTLSAISWPYLGRYIVICGKSTLICTRSISIRPRSAKSAAFQAYPRRFIAISEKASLTLSREGSFAADQGCAAGDQG